MSALLKKTVTSSRCHLLSETRENFHLSVGACCDPNSRGTGAKGMDTWKPFHQKGMLSFRLRSLVSTELETIEFLWSLAKTVRIFSTCKGYSVVLSSELSVVYLDRMAKDKGRQWQWPEHCHAQAMEPRPSPGASVMVGGICSHTLSFLGHRKQQEMSLTKDSSIDLGAPAVSVFSCCFTVSFWRCLQQWKLLTLHEDAAGDSSECITVVMANHSCTACYSHIVTDAWGGCINECKYLRGKASLVAQRLKHLPTIRETQVRSLAWGDHLEKEMATHSSILAWRIPWMEEPGRLQSTGVQRVGHDWATSRRRRGRGKSSRYL